MSGEFTLKEVLSQAHSQYDYILIDGMPSLGSLPGNATPEPGMLILFKWYGSDAIVADHVGIVERVENGRVYTIEGNSGDRVRQNSYPIGYGEILGYGFLVCRI